LVSSEGSRGEDGNVDFDKQPKGHVDFDENSGLIPISPARMYLSPSSARVRQSVKFEDEIDREQEEERIHQDEGLKIVTNWRAQAGKFVIRSCTYFGRATKAAVVGLVKGLQACTPFYCTKLSMGGLLTPPPPLHYNVACRTKVKQHVIFERPADFRFPLRLLVTACVVRDTLLLFSGISLFFFRACLQLFWWV